MQKIIDQISINEKYCGPPNAANGGYLAGRLAQYIAVKDQAVRVSLRAATPLNTILSVVETNTDSGKVLELMDGDKLLAIAREEPIEIPKPAFPKTDDIAAVTMQCAGYGDHPFPRCFVCGPERPVGDGLGIYPGPVTEEQGAGTVVAAEWTLADTLKDPQGQVQTEFIWAALDCISAFAILEEPAHQKLVPMVLGTLSANIEQALAGDKAYVMAWPLKVDGRKAYATSAVFDQQQVCIAAAQAVWVSLNK